MSATSKLSKKEIELRASLGLVKDYTTGTVTQDPRFALNPTRQEYDTYLEIYTKDSIVSGSVDTVGEEAVKNRGYFIGPEREVKRAETLFKELQFYDRMEVHVKTQHIYGDSFIEKRFDDQTGKLSELHNLETTEMWILYNKHGEVVGYEQNQWDIVNSRPEITSFIASWTPEQVIFMPLKRLGSKVHSYSPLEPAMRALVARTYAHYFLQSVFQNFKPQLFLSVDNNISKAQTRSLIEAIRAADKDPSKKILSIGNLDVKTGGMYEFKKDIVDILNYFRQEVLTATKVPGIYVGITADSNRGVGEFEANAFVSHLLKIHRQIELIAEDILKTSGIPGVTFKMRPPSIKNQSDVIEQANKLRSMGYGDDVVTKYLYENGIPIDITAKFEQPKEKLMDEYESRQSEGKGVTEGKFNLNEHGRSEAGKAKMEQNDKSLRSAIADIRAKLGRL